MWFCTPPGTSNEYGETIPIRTAQAPHNHSFCSMCQSCGCSAMPAANASASRWVTILTRTSSGALVRRGQLDPPQERRCTGRA